mmetsp:Transcript_15452/g.22038  ORF Transcript_15452/g.22038 Transcript_15452/m.22038 type:complete len:104 (-) Transcript_15452:278-589(-)
MAAQLSITGSFGDYDYMTTRLQNIGITNVRTVGLMDEECIDSGQEMAYACDANNKLMVDNVNKMFGSKMDGTRVYYAPVKIISLKTTTLYLHRSLIIRQISDV